MLLFRSVRKVMTILEGRVWDPVIPEFILSPLKFNLIPYNNLIHSDSLDYSNSVFGLVVKHK